MGQREKFWIAVLGFAILSLAFVAGQVFFYTRQGSFIERDLGALPKAESVKDKSNVGIGTASNLSAKLLDSVQKELILVSGEKEFRVKPQELKTWIESYTRSWSNRQEYRINREKIRLYLKNISKEIDTPPVNARFSISEGKIAEFVPPQKGRLLNISESLTNIISVLKQGGDPALLQKVPGGSSFGPNDSKRSLELVVDEIEPELTPDKINDLGINTLLGRGESNFAGSAASRIHNIDVSSKIFNGLLLKSGQEFSFNRLLGFVGPSSGYLPELVIKSGTLTPEYGGGICQVSTTLFRTVMSAGLAILERHPHSLPVRYYNPQGFDATVYPDVSDFRFKNDSPAYILIQSKISGSNLYFEIYGTSDGRKVAIDGPYQYNIKPDGSLKATLTRTITYADGTEKKDVFNSSYKSPSLFPLVKNPLE